MTRQEALQTLQHYTKSQALIRHHLAVEAAMRNICRVYSSRTHNFFNEELWAITALLHDADYELTRNIPSTHTLLLEQKMGNVLPKEALYAIKAHNYKVTKLAPVSAMDWALYTCDELTGFVIAAAIDQKEKKLSTVTTNNVIKRIMDKNYAKTVDRAQIMACEKSLQFALPQYTGIILAAMQTIAIDLGFEA